MPGIFDVLAANGILSSLFGGQRPRGMDTGDDTQRMLNRQAAALSQQAAPKAVAQPSPRARGQANAAPVPMIVQAMQNDGVPVAPQAQASGSSFLPADAEQEIAQAEMDPRSIVPAADPYTNTSNAAGVAFQNQLAAQDGGGNFNKFVRAADIIGKGLMAAGSSDPARTLAMFQEADAERNRTKVTPLADGAFSMVQEPGKPARIVRNDQVAQYLGDKQRTAFEQALEKVRVGADAQARVASEKAAIKTGEEARPILNDVNSLMDRWNQAKEIVSGQGTMAQVQGAFPTIAGFFGGDQVAANKFLEGLTVDETLLNTARTKGAISNQEMTLFKAPIPSLTDDREKVWKPWIEKRLEVLGKLKTFAEGEVARGAAAGGGSSAAPAPTPAPSSSGGMTVPGLSPNASKYFK